MKKAILVTLLPFMLLFTFEARTAEAQDMKIGYVEPRLILERMPEMRAVQQRIQNFVERKREELADQEMAFQREVEEYQQKIGVISDAARQQEEERLGQMQFDLQQSQNQIRQEIEQRQAELMAPLLDQIQSSISVVAREKGIDYVLNTTTRAGDVIILYVREDLQNEYDITDAVMRNLGI